MLKCRNKDQIFFLIFVLVILLMSQVADAAPRAKTKGRTIRIQEVRIEGRIQKPQASYILQRSGKVDLGVDVRLLKPAMTSGYEDILDREPELFRVDRR